MKPGNRVPPGQIADRQCSSAPEKFHKGMDPSQSLHNAWATLEFVLLFSVLQINAPASRSFGSSTPFTGEKKVGGGRGGNTHDGAAYFVTIKLAYLMSNH